MPRRRLAVVFVILAAVTSSGTGVQDPIERIREADLKADLFALAGDAMRGREAGTLDEMTASAWVAERARGAGLLPAGDNGTYFQFFPLERFRVSAGSTVTLDGKPLRMGRDVVTDAIVFATVDAPVTVAPDDTVEGLAIKDRVLVVRYARRGTIRSTARAGTTGAIILPTRARACRRCSSRRCCTPTTTRRSTTRIASTSRNWRR